MPTNSNTKRKKVIELIREWITKLRRKHLKPKHYEEKELTADGYTPAPTHICKEYKNKQRKH